MDTFQKIEEKRLEEDLDFYLMLQLLQFLQKQERYKKDLKIKLQKFMIIIHKDTNSQLNKSY